MASQNFSGYEPKIKLTVSELSRGLLNGGILFELSHMVVIIYKHYFAYYNN